MIRCLPLFVLVLAALPLQASPDMDRLLDAVWKAEGGKKARVPYGITTVRVNSPSHGRAIARRTLARALRERPDLPWIEATARAYCPAEADLKGHKAWKKNVWFFYNKNEARQKSEPE